MKIFRKRKFLLFEQTESGKWELELVADKPMRPQLNNALFMHVLMQDNLDSPCFQIRVVS